MKINWKLILAVVLIAAGATGVTLNEKTRAQVLKVWKEIEKATSHHSEEPPPDKSWLKESKPKQTWDRTVALTDDEIKAIGLETTAVLSQTEPTILSLFGTTDYDPATVTTVRVMFDSRVDKVLVDLGSVIKEKQPLLELFSADLAAAKSDYELAQSQWDHDKKVLNYKSPLARENTLPKKELIEVENDEAQSRLKMKLAKDKLLVYGLTEQEIEAAKNEDGQEKARMTLRARADGVLVSRDVVNGNYYDSSSGRVAADHRPAGPPLGARGRQRARRREGRGRPDVEGDLPVLGLRRRDQEHDRLHRQSDRSRDAIGQVPHDDPQPRGPLQGRGVREGPGDGPPEGGADGHPSVGDGLGRQLGLRLHPPAGQGRGRTVRAAADHRGQGEQRHRRRRRARRGAPRAQPRASTSRRSAA